jgi:hypothetical protein
VPKTSSLVEEVLAEVEAAKARRRDWFALLPPEAQEELEYLRSEYDPATCIKRHFACAIIAAGKRRGWPMPKEKQVTLWLDGR